MPVISLHLISLHVPLLHFLAALSRSSLRPITVNRVVRWIIKPTQFSTETLLNPTTKWDVLLVLPPEEDNLPRDLQKLIKNEWIVKAGVPGRILLGFGMRNERLLNPRQGDVPPRSAESKYSKGAQSAQGMELSSELQEWVTEFAKGAGAHPISMWNLLAFNEGKKASYLQYGKEFGETIGKRHGGVAKIVGKVSSTSTTPEGQHEWDEIAIAHYPSIYHFADMIASEDYQRSNKEFRLPALKDTFILCTTEVDVPWPVPPKL